MQAGMERRRKAILTAAHDLLARGEPPSMRELAEAAGVAQATPYNLFGNKRSLYRALHRELEADLLTRLATSPASDALDRMYEAIRLMTHSLAEEPALYRTIFATIYASEADSADLHSAAAFWDALMPPMVAEGMIDRGVDIAAFTRNFVYLLAGVLIDWTDRRIEVSEVEAAMRYGFTLAALGVATEQARPRLRRVLDGR